MARSLLVEAGFAGDLLDTMLGIEWWECYDPNTGLHYWDAVGDLGITDDKWGPSIGAAQIRSLRYPEQYPFPDTLRIAEALLDPRYNASTALAICEGGRRLDKWTAYKSGAYLVHKGEDFELHSGHVRAHLWNS